MPIYAYQCQDCSHTVEILQKISDAPLTECPACHRPSLVKQVTAAGFQLKGSGWYATDFKGNGTKPKAAKGEGKADSDTGSETAKPADASSEGTKSSSTPTAPTPAPASGPSPASA